MTAWCAWLDALEIDFVCWCRLFFFKTPFITIFYLSSPPSLFSFTELKSFTVNWPPFINIYNAFLFSLLYTLLLVSSWFDCFPFHPFKAIDFLLSIDSSFCSCNFFLDDGLLCNDVADRDDFLYRTKSWYFILFDSSSSLYKN